MLAALHPERTTKEVKMAKGQVKQGNNNKPKLTTKEKKQKKKGKAEVKDPFKPAD